MRGHSLLGVLLLAGCMQPRRSYRGTAPLPAEPEAIRVAGVAQLAGYSSAVKVGLVVEIAGQVGIDSAGHLAGDDLGAQGAQALTNLVAVVRAARGTPEDVVKLTFYYVPNAPGDAATITGLVEATLSRRHPPALTLVPVTTLPLSGLRIAVDGVAMLRGEFPDRGRNRDSY